MEIYIQKLRPDGSIKKNKYGMEMIDCTRGTNMTEAYHKNLLQSFFGWHTGVEMSTCLLTKQRHRGNYRCSEIKREDFPKIGHYNTWLID